MDKTLGFGQLRSTREASTPLALKTQFRDKICQYNVIARRLLQDEGHTLDVFAFENIPDESTAVRVILSLVNMILEDEGAIIAYHGLKGAGWIIAHSRQVLGLQVYIFKTSATSVPCPYLQGGR